MRYVLFVLFSFALLAAILLAVWRDRQRDWVGHQEEYARLVRPAAGTGQAAPAAKGEAAVKGIAQINVPALGVLDRCTTCHLGVTEERAAAWPQPLTAHPEPFLRFHPVESFGCTVCHRGDGLGTSVDGGHGRKASWKYPLLPAAFLEAPCLGCHAQPRVVEAPRAVRGQQLFERLNCLGCHTVSGRELPAEAKTSLDHLPRKTSAAWVRRYLQDPQQVWPAARMPNYRFKEEQLDALVAYLMSEEEPAASAAAGSPLPRPELRAEELAQADAEVGKQLFERSACRTCHDFSGPEPEGLLAPEKIGPPLTALGEKVNAAWLVGYLQDNRREQPSGRMPAYRFSRREALNLASYLLSRAADEKPAARHTSAPPALPSERGGGAVSSEEQLRKRGREIVLSSNCTGCHLLRGLPKGSPGPDLTKFALKGVEELDFGSNELGANRTAESWLFAKIMTPHTFYEDARMPYPNVAMEDTDALATFILSLPHKPPQKYRVPSASDRAPTMLHKGELSAVVERYRCLTCHRIGAQGGDIGPDLTALGSRVTPAWLRRYLAEPQPRNPLSSARMPDFRLTDNEIEVLVAYATSMLRADGLGPHPGKEESTEALIQEGRRLFSRVHPCIACHRVGERGGRVGPDLSSAGARLQPAWVRGMMQTPELLVRHTRMPNLGISDTEAAAMTAYLMSLKTDDAQ
ncbi:MAG: c-type cytochrome [Candidatus Tectomicrobia bacterium]|nr:c-type cytochrome [Candidatus Tectomicrobia bacterium]